MPPCAVPVVFPLVLVLCLAASSSRAGNHAYGEHFIRLGQYWGEETRVRPGPPGGQAEDADVQKYQQQMLALEEAGGPYADMLSEPLMGMGWHYRQQGELEQALGSFQRALHVVRINDGLYSERQVPIVQALLDVYRSSGEYESLDERYDYYFRLFGNGKPPFTDIRLRAALAYLRWQREAVRLDIDDEESRRLFALYRLNESLLKAVAADASVPWHWYRDLALSQLKNLYLVQDRVAATAHSNGLSLSRQSMQGEWEEKDINKKQLERIQRDGAPQGTRLLDETIRRYDGPSDSVELARLYLAKGDWYQWLGREQQANGAYQAVAELLAGAGREDLLQQWLGQPVELPDNGAFWQPSSSPAPAVAAVIKLQYDVSARGRVRNLSAQADDSVSKGKVAGLKRRFRQIRFRPRWHSGTAQAVQQLQREYVLLN